METNAIKGIMKKEMETEKEIIQDHMGKITKEMSITKNEIMIELGAAKETLVDANNKLQKGITENMDVVKSELQNGIGALMAGVKTNLTNVNENMESGLGQVSSAMETSKND